MKNYVKGREMNSLLLLSLAAGVLTLDVPVQTMTAGEELTGSGREVSVRVPEGLPGFRPGMPDLPGVFWVFPLPPGEELLSVEPAEARWEALPGARAVRPLPPQIPLIMDDGASLPVSGDPSVYGVPEFWPSTPVTAAGTSIRDGVPHGEVLVFPYRYNPVTGELQRLVELRLHAATVGSLRRPVKGPDSPGMLIVTTPSMTGVFQQLAQRRTDEGIVTRVVTMDEVLEASRGRDDAEALRNYIISYKQTEGLDYVLLGGDIEHVPMRYAFAMECGAGFHPREDSLPCDLYFSDLDGDWDGNGNGVFGEIGDDVDLYPDVWVGRVSVNGPEEAEAWYEKLKAYEDCADPGYMTEVLFLAEVLWTSPFTDGGVSKNMIQAVCLPGFMNVTKLYQTLGNLNGGNVMAALNAGTNMVNHNGHAWWNGMCIGGGSIDAAFLNSVNSQGRYSAFFYSIGCWSAAFDFDAVAEHFLTSPQGCGVAFIGNSSYGWGSPGNPAYGYSDILDRLFFLRLYQNRNTRIGQVLAESKDFYIPYGRWENVYRWHLYQVNLLGDPSFRPYRKQPLTPVLEYPAFVTPDTRVFPVRVSGCDPDGLMLCVRDQGDNLLTAELDPSGYHCFQFDSGVDGAVTITLTGSEVRRTSLVCPQGGGPAPAVSDVIVDDSGGDGFLSPGDSAYITLSLVNQGTDPISGIALTARVLSGPAELLEDSMTFPDLAPGDSATGSAPLKVTIDADALNNTPVGFMLRVTSQQGSWEMPLSLLVHAPGLYFACYDVDDGGDNVPQPGETFTLTVTVADTGLLDAHGVRVIMERTPGWVSFENDTVLCPVIPAGSTGDFPFQCTLAPEAPSPSFPWFRLVLEAETTGYSRVDSLRFTVGETGISNDVESGAAGWTHGGTGDLWRISDTDSHSPSHSWQCAGDQGYQPGMDCWLAGPDMYLAPNSTLSFWTSFDVALYGSDGLYPVLHDLTSSLRDTLDFIGSGGALAGSGKGMGTGWVNLVYDLSFADPENLYRVEFIFRSDMDGVTGNGFFIDDIVVSGGYLGDLGTEDPEPAPPVLGTPRPNPSFSVFSTPVNVPEPGEFTLDMYDLSGRLVRSFPGVGPFCGSIPGDGGGLPSGLYLLRLSGIPGPAQRLVILR